MPSRDWCLLSNACGKVSNRHQGKLHKNFDEMVRRKQLKLNVAVLIAKYNNMYEELRHLSRRRIPVTSIHGNISIVSTQITETIQPATRHDFVARILGKKRLPSQLSATSVFRL